MHKHIYFEGTNTKTGTKWQLTRRANNGNIFEIWNKPSDCPEYSCQDVADITESGEFSRILSTFAHNLGETPKLTL